MKGFTGCRCRVLPLKIRRLTQLIYGGWSPRLRALGERSMGFALRRGLRRAQWEDRCWPRRPAWPRPPTDWLLGFAPSFQPPFVLLPFRFLGVLAGTHAFWKLNKDLWV